MEQAELLKYRTLSGEEITLDGFTEEGNRLLVKIYNDFKEGKEYGKVLNKLHSSDALKILGAIEQKGGYFIDKKVASSPLYKITFDLVDRLGVTQGLLRADAQNNINFSDNSAVLEQLVSKYSS